MAQVFEAVRKEERDGKTYWKKVGIVMFVSQFNNNGQIEMRYSMIDDRTGIRYNLFEKQRRQQQAPGQFQNGQYPAPQLQGNPTYPAPPNNPTQGNFAGVPAGSYPPPQPMPQPMPQPVAQPQPTPNPAPPSHGTIDPNDPTIPNF